MLGEPLAQLHVERLRLGGEHCSARPVPQSLQRRVGHVREQRPDVRIGVVLLREQERPEIGIELAEKRERLLRPRSAGGVYPSQGVAVEVLEPRVVAGAARRRPAPGARAARHAPQGAQRLRDPPRERRLVLVTNQLQLARCGAPRRGRHGGSLARTGVRSVAPRVTAVTDNSAIDEAAVRREAVDGGLLVRLDAPIPRELAVGAGTAVFVCGWCYSPRRQVRALSLGGGGDVQPVIAHGMPRLDVLLALHPGLDPYDTRGLASDPESADDPLFHSYLSGFWGIARIAAASAGGSCELLLRAELEGGGESTVELARIDTSGRRDALPLPELEPSPGPLVAICMATYDPPMDLFQRQLDSIRGQTHRNWVCVVSDDCSSPKRFEAVKAAVAGDPRFVVSRSPGRIGFYRNFERALAMVPVEADFVAMTDQDDDWHPDKLETLVRELGTAQLVYSDARIVGRDGELISDTYWTRRRNNHSSLLSLLVANSVTGAASLFRKELLDYALPFPPAQFAHYHDHWIGLTALALGDIAFVDRPVYDYVQHGEASLGHAAANTMTALRDRVGRLRRDPRERVRMWRMHYFVDVRRLMQVATVLQMRCGGRMSRAKRRTLERFMRTDRSLLLLGAFWLRGARELVGRPETLGAEWMLSYAFTWRRALAATTRERPVRGLRLDAVPPPNLAPKPGRRTPEDPGPRAVAEKIAPLEL